MLLFQVFLVELFELVEWNGFRIVVKIYVGGSGMINNSLFGPCNVLNASSLK